ncbi:DNA polymerase III subunit beta [Candidatus Phytoplasma prunorum]|uniref:DNA polymerase III subunit beta n=1 Tax=Candidatus Phytoplasma prunorum TaxID=47565 RepID=UPI002FEF1615
MHFKIKKEIFLEQLLKIQKIIPNKTFFPIFLGIKLKIKKNFLILESTDGNTSIKIKIKNESLKIKEEGSLLISGKYFIEIIKKINSDYIEMIKTENNSLTIKTKLLEYNLKLMNLNYFPKINFFLEFKEKIEIKSNIFKKIIKEIKISASKDEKKSILTGVNFVYQKPFLKVLSTDYFRLSQKKIKLDFDYKNFNIVIHYKILEELSKILEYYENDNLQIYFNSKKMFLKTDNLFFQTILLEGEFPKTQEILENNFINKIKLDKEKLIKTLERVSFISNKDVNDVNVVKLKIKKEKKVEISSYNDEIGNIIEEILPLENISAKEIEISFNAKYLEDILKVFLVKEITISFQSAFKPFIITSFEDKTSLHLILPLIN